MNDEYSFLKGTGRRRFIKGGGSLVALGSLPVYLTAKPERLVQPLAELQQRRGIVLYRDNDLHSRSFAETLSATGIHAVALTDDPVRQWRKSLSQMAAEKGMPVMGLSNWADYLMISGLAAEQRKHVMLELQHAVYQPQAEKESWSCELALEYLQLPKITDKDLMQTHFSKLLDKKLRPGTQSLFSWFIA